MGRQFTLPVDLPLMLLIGSFAEEFFFRGYLQEDFKKRFGGNIWISLVITKDEKGGNSLFYSMAAHGLYNLVVTSVGTF